MTLIGCIADDLTGATDAAVTFSREGLSVIQVNGVPDAALDIANADAIVVALKSRTIAAAEAVAQSLAAASWLRRRGAARIYFKVCSTFDSTPAGNIGPVADSLLDATGARLNVVTPAYPRNGRTVYQGHLFVGDALLSDTGMRTHPLTPMTESNLVRVLQAQTPHRVGLLPCAVVAQGEEALRQRLDALASEGVRHVIADAIDDAHLHALGRALRPQWLATGGAGLAAGLAAALRDQARATAASAIDWPRGPGAILAGSCSAATLQQLAALGDALPRRRLDPLRLARGSDEVAAAIDWARRHLGDRPLLRGGAACDRGGAGAGGREPLRRRRRRDLRRRGRGARRARAGDRPRDRPRRAVDPRRRRQALCAGAEVRQLRRAGLLQPRLRARAVKRRRR